MSFITGECLCGQITVSIDKQLLDAGDKILLCHCKNCRKTSGSFGSIAITVPESAVKVTGQLKTYPDGNTDSGIVLYRTFCGNCGSPISTTAANLPGQKIIRLGLLDEIPKPAMEFYCESRLSWVKSIDDAKQYDTMPPK